MAEPQTVTDPGVPAKKKARTKRQLEDFLALARDRFSQAEEADEAQRERELSDLAFFAGEQWDKDTLTRRAAQSAKDGLPPVPARPCFVINKQREPVRQVLNQERQSDLGIELVAADDFGDLAPPIDDTEVQLREGLVRRIQRDSHAQDARTWAFARAVQAGRGYYLVMTRYLPGKTWDQEVYVQRLYNQASVSLDPAHEQPDGSDAEWGFVGRDMPWAEYKATYAVKGDGTKNDVARADKEEFRAYGESYPGWFTADGETRSCRVADYYYTARETRSLAILEDGSVHWADEVPDGQKPVDTREVVEKTIKWAQLDGAQILDETDWPGPDLPIVKVVGEELQPFDEERRYEGMVRPSRDSQQGFNAMVSKWVETVGLAPIPPFQVADGQVEGYENWYQVANTRTLPYLPYRSKDSDGMIVGPPPRTPVDTPIQAIAGSVQMFDEAIQSTTGVPEARAGRNTDSHLKSGKALEALQRASEQGTSNYLDNLQRSIRYEAQIINGLLYPIYNRPGRLARILNGEGEPETVLLHQPSIVQGGRPRPAEASDPNAKQYTLTKDAKFNVVVNITKNKGTRRQEEVELVGQLISADPNLMGVFGDLFFKYQDGPGHTEMAERAKAMLVPPVQALLSSQKNGQAAPDPATQALQQQLTQAQQAIQQLQQQVQTDSIKAQATIKGKEIDATSAKELQILKNASAIAVAKIAATAKGAQQHAEDMDEAVALGLEQAHEAQMMELEHQQTLEQQQQAHAHGLEAGQQQAAMGAQQAEQAHAQNLEAGDVGHQQNLEAAEQQAALQPAPEAEA